MKRIQLKKIFKSNQVSESVIFLNCSIDYNGKINILVVDGKYDNRSENKMFFKVTPHSPQNYKLIIVDEETKIVDFINQKMNFTEAMQITKDKYIFTCARSEFRNDSDFDRNCKVVNTSGNIINEFCIGDGVQDIQTNEKSEIWVSYFDEGIFGNYGWENPIGKNGLNCFDINGALIYQYTSPSYELSISDCYALNVVGNNQVWIYFYTDFPLLKITNNKIENSWKLPIEGSNSFAVKDSKILMSKGYNKNFQFILFDINENIKVIEEYEFYSESDEKLMYVCHAQSDSLYFWQNNSLYIVKIDDLL